MENKQLIEKIYNDLRRNNNDFKRLALDAQGEMVMRLACEIKSIVKEK